MARWFSATAAGILAVTVVAGVPAAQAQFQHATSPAMSLSPVTLGHIAKSMMLAKGIVPEAAISSYYNTVRLSKLVDPSFLPPGSDNFAPGRAHPALPPTKLFDQLYFIGDEHVGAYVLVTSEGIIQWDAMNNDKEASEIIDAGYRKLHLDPAQIRYLIITHSHSDHYGGVNYFKRKYPSIEVIASAADWDVIEKAGRDGKDTPAISPARGRAVKDGEQLVLGNTEIRFYITPGHTPGTLSSLVPVTDKGKPHLMGMFGGVGIPLDVTAIDRYDASWTRFDQIAAAAGVDGILSTHEAYDGGLFYITDPGQRKGRRNPWVIGRAGFHKYVAAVHEAAMAVRGILKETGFKNH